ncbi:pentatricopeptide repeat-containing protein At3g04750, mitochondrial [Aristolochia californica]|uniref:pentatricopeptide repeat-containing protein At3g04750, mitochondrial n=1 Tax=Aristolochia californica TaxID=171875 RepID=UPI0035DF29BF
MVHFSHWSRLICSAALTSSRITWNPLVSLTFSHPTLLLLEKCKTRKQFKQILAQMIRVDLTSQVFPISRLLHFSAVAHPENIGMAIILFNHFTSKPNLYIFNIMIAALPSSTQCFSLYKSMLQLSIYPDKQTLLSLLKASESISEGKQIHSHTIVTGVSSHPYIQNSLIKMYSENGNISLAQQVFEQMLNPDTVSWNILISAYSKNSWVLEALGLFCKMVNLGLKPDEFTMVSLLTACGKLRDLRRGKLVHACVARRKSISGSNLIIGNALLDFYVKCGKLECARKVFDGLDERDVISWNTIIGGFATMGELEMAYDYFNEMPYRDLVSWNSLIAGYSQNGSSTAARELFLAMIKENVRPDTVTIIYLVSSAAEMGDAIQGRWIHGWMVRNLVEIDAFVGSAMIDMYCKCGCIKKAFKVFEVVEERDVTVWTALIAGLAFHGCGREALAMYSKMQENLMPNNVTLVAVLTACSHSGMVDQGLQIFNSMNRNYGIEPRVEHYGCLVDLLARSGRLTEAKNVIDNMPMCPSRSVWGALLNACKVHGNINLAEVATRELQKLEPDKEGGYVFLSNLYAASGRWRYSNKIREIMENKGLKKMAGCSWMVINGVVHEFIAYDNRHIQCVDIYNLLDSLNRGMRSHGDVLM